MNEFILSTLTLSLAVNGALSLLYWRSRKTPQKRLSVSAQEILHDLTGNGAMIEIRRLSPGDYLMRSPRD